MKRDDIRQKMEKFLQYMREEQDIRDQLTALQFVAEDEVRLQETMSQQNHLLRSLDHLRQEKMLPLLDEVAAFVASKKQDLGK